MQRLKQRAEFQAVLATATLARTTHFALHGLMSPSPCGTTAARPDVEPGNASSAGRSLACQVPRMGAMVPKRWAKRAVTRNTIKRQIYAVSAQFHNALPPRDYVVRLRSTYGAQHFTSATSQQLRVAVRTELAQLFAQATQASIA